MRKQFYYLWILLLVTGCSQHPISMSRFTPREVIRVDPSKEDRQTFLEKLNQKIDTLGLTVLKDVVFSFNMQILADGEKFFILDRENFNIYIFSKEGELLYRIDKRGRGPGEYVNLNNISLNSRSQIGVLDPATSRFLVFNDRGMMVNQVKLSGAPEAATFFQDTLILALSRYTLLMKASDPCASLCDFSGKQIKKFLPLPDWVRNTWAMRDCFSSTFDPPVFYFPMTRHIFSVENGEAYCKYEVDFLDKTMSEEILQTIDMISFISVLSKAKKADMISNFQETATHVLFTYQDFSVKGSRHHCLYDKRTKEALVIKQIGVWSMLMSMVCTSTKTGEFIFMLSADKAFVLSELFEKSKEEIKDRRLRPIIQQINGFIRDGLITKEGDEVVLVTVKFK